MKEEGELNKQEYLKHKRSFAKLISIGVSIVLIGVVLLLVTSGIGELKANGVEDIIEKYETMGTLALLSTAIVAVALFINT